MASVKLCVAAVGDPMGTFGRIRKSAAFPSEEPVVGTCLPAADSQAEVNAAGKCALGYLSLRAVPWLLPLSLLLLIPCSF